MDSMMCKLGASLAVLGVRGGDGNGGDVATDVGVKMNFQTQNLCYDLVMWIAQCYCIGNIKTCV